MLGQWLKNCIGMKQPQIVTKQKFALKYVLIIFALLGGMVHANSQPVFAQTTEKLGQRTAALEENVQSVSEDVEIPKASSFTQAAGNLYQILIAGGPTLLPIYVASFILMLVVFERTVSLRRGRILPKHFVRRMLHQLQEGSIDRNEALLRCEENSSDIANVFAGALRKWGKPAVEVEQAVLDAGERTANYLRKYLRVINGVATVCPLLGLLGTVLGMMQAFNDISSSSAIGRPELLAGGISQALVSTAAGMFVAIPALIFYMYFVGRVDSLVMDIDAKGQELVSLISAEGLVDRPKVIAKPTKKRTSNVKTKAKKKAA